ncbi:MAG: hypothetical protein J6R86_04225, partial [Lentisphaeria bacterium]|nr:hypothetical protein [Lentisphaeria bacterium]
QQSVIFPPFFVVNPDFLMRKRSVKTVKVRGILVGWEPRRLSGGFSAGGSDDLLSKSSCHCHHILLPLLIVSFISCVFNWDFLFCS